MSRKIERYCAPPGVVALLQKDGIGWGHDLTSGCFDHEALPKRTWIQRLRRNRK